MEINPKATAAGLVGAAAIAATLFMPFEGERLTANLDPVSIREICYGHTGVVIPDVATDHQCVVYLGKDTTMASNIVDENVEVALSDNTKAAFISFVYNMGNKRFEHSTMLRLLNKGDVVGACNQLTRWIYAGKRVLNGLVKRREAEKRLCLSGVQNAH